MFEKKNYFLYPRCKSSFGQSLNSLSTGKCGTVRLRNIVFNLKTWRYVKYDICINAPLLLMFILPQYMLFVSSNSLFVTEETTFLSSQLSGKTVEIAGPSQAVVSPKALHSGSFVCRNSNSLSAFDPTFACAVCERTHKAAGD